MKLIKGESYMFSQDGVKWDKRIFHHLSKKNKKFAVLKKKTEYSYAFTLGGIKNVPDMRVYFDYFKHFKPLEEKKYHFKKNEGEKLLQPQEKDNTRSSLMSFEDVIYELNKSLIASEKTINNRIDNIVFAVNNDLENNKKLYNYCNEAIQQQETNQLVFNERLKQIETKQIHKPKPKRKPIKIDAFGWISSGIAIGFLTMFILTQIFN